MLNAKQAEELSAKIQAGGRLLFTLDASPGITPLLLGNALPSTGWATQLRLSQFTQRTALRVREMDGTFFPASLDELTVPFCFDIRPAPAVERGQARYERYAFVHPYLHVPVAAGSNFCSRTLLNRNWKVRARLNDLAEMPLVVTGRYGAGRVAMVATSAHAIGESAAARGFWKAVLVWLREQDEAKARGGAKPGVVSLFVDGEVHVKLSNPSAEAMRLEVVVRAKAPDGAILADGDGEARGAAEVEAGQTKTLKLRVGAGLIAAAAARGKRLPVRVGVLSADGATLIAEQSLLSPTAAIQLKIETDNLYGVAYPFHAPGPDALISFQARMGAYVGSYAYAAGSVIRGSVILSNGLENVAPLSSIQDLTTAGNLSVMALNDEAMSLRQQPNFDRIAAYSMWTGKAGVENVLDFNLPEDTQVSEVVLVGTFGRFGNGNLHRPGGAAIELDGRRVAAIDDLDGLLASGVWTGATLVSAEPRQKLTLRLPWVAKTEGFDRQEPWLGEIKVGGWQGDRAGRTRRGSWRLRWWMY